MNSCSKTFTCQASVCRHLSRCHTSHDIIRQIDTKYKQFSHRQYSVQSLLSGFNSRKLNQENRISQPMKRLIEVLLKEDNLVEVPDDGMNRDTNRNSFDTDLLKGYAEIGLIEL